MITIYNDQPDKLRSQVSELWEKYPIPRHVIINSNPTQTRAQFWTASPSASQQTYWEYMKSKLTRNIQSGNSNEEKENWSKYISIYLILWFVFFTY
jgi:hypothetical protein